MTDSAKNTAAISGRKHLGHLRHHLTLHQHQHRHIRPHPRQSLPSEHLEHLQPPLSQLHDHHQQPLKPHLCKCITEQNNHQGHGIYEWSHMTTFVTMIVSSVFSSFKLIHRPSRTSSISSILPSSLSSLIIMVIITINHQNVNCLRITLLDIPSPLVVGESAELTCNYDLEDNTLYSFKWYKDGIEFYRYVPRDYPPTQYLKMSGINVDIRKSTKKSVFLHNVNLATRGKYRCEISAEAPSFVTAAKEGNLEINVLPNNGPKITTDQNEYTLGDEIQANCTSDRSNLDILLNFTINDEPITNSIEYEVKYSTQLHTDSLKTSIISIRFQLNEKNFAQKKLKLKCLSSIPLYNIRNEAIKIIKDYHHYHQNQPSNTDDQIPFHYYPPLSRQSNQQRSPPSSSLSSAVSSAASSSAISSLSPSGEHQARTEVLNVPYGSPYGHQPEMNMVKCIYILFTTIIHWQFQNLFQ